MQFNEPIHFKGMIWNGPISKIEFAVQWKADIQMGDYPIVMLNDNLRRKSVRRVLLDITKKVVVWKRNRKIEAIFHIIYARIRFGSCIYFTTEYFSASNLSNHLLSLTCHCYCGFKAIKKIWTTMARRVLNFQNLLVM